MKHPEIIFVFYNVFYSYIKVNINSKRKYRDCQKAQKTRAGMSQKYMKTMSVEI